MNEVFSKLTKSWKKLFVLAASVITIANGQELGLDSEAIQSLTAVVAAYLVGQGIADFGKGKAEAENGNYSSTGSGST